MGPIQYNQDETFIPYLDADPGRPLAQQLQLHSSKPVVKIDGNDFDDHALLQVT